MFNCVVENLHPKAHQSEIDVSNHYKKATSLYRYAFVLLGVVPLSLFFVKAGTMLQELTDVGVTSVASVYTLALYAVISIAPIFFQNQIKNFLSK